jgi:hypothetical protein
MCTHQVKQGELTKRNQLQRRRKLKAKTTKAFQKNSTQTNKQPRRFLWNAYRMKNDVHKQLIFQFISFASILSCRRAFFYTLTWFLFSCFMLNLGADV